MNYDIEAAHTFISEATGLTRRAVWRAWVCEMSYYVLAGVLAPDDPSVPVEVRDFDWLRLRVEHRNLLPERSQSGRLVIDEASVAKWIVRSKALATIDHALAYLRAEVEYQEQTGTVMRLI
jgi:hypothetical protein